VADRIRAEPKDAAPLSGRPWTRHYDPGVPATLEYPDVPLHALLEDAARSHTDATATVFHGRRRSYRSLQRDATFFSAGLRRLGVRKGDRVALLLPNCPQLLIAFFGALRIGAVAVPCDPLSTPRELQQRLADCGAETAVTLDVATLKAARLGTALRSVIVTSLADELPALAPLRFLLAAGRRVAWRRDPGTIALRELLVDAGEPVAAPVSAADLAVIQYTAGTTGAPKGAMLSHGALLAAALQCRAWLAGLRDGRDSILAAVPVAGAFGLTAGMHLAAQSAAALVLEPWLEPAQLLDLVRSHRPTVLLAAPGTYDAIAGSLPAAADALRPVALLSGPAPLGEATARRFADAGLRLVEGYGLAEAPLTHCNPLGGAGKRGSVGLPLPGVESRIVDLESGTRELRPGEDGELVVRGPQLMDGYHERPDETARAIRDGWLHTDDVARADEDGFVFVTGRKNGAASRTGS
jgi:long-chain acyl-CoA synthetase